MSPSLLDKFDRPLKSLRLSVTDRCNFRCTYCMPEQDYRWLPKQQLLNFTELSQLVDAFISVGVDRLRITGGEPLMRQDLATLIGMLRKKPGLREIALTTNGVLLQEQAKGLAAAGLDRLTVSLDTLKADRFAKLTGRASLDKVLSGIEAAQGVGLAKNLKLDVVALRGVNDDELIDLLRFAGDIGAEVRFIEYMDVGGATSWDQVAVLTRADMLETISASLGPAVLLPAPVLLPARGAAPAERFRLPNGQVFGIIASTTQPFCGSCDRSRVTADGMWYHCLYAVKGIDLKTVMRAEGGPQALPAVLRGNWSARTAKGAEVRASLPNRGAFVPVDALRRNPHLEMHTRGG